MCACEKQEGERGNDIERLRESEWVFCRAAG